MAKKRYFGDDGEYGPYGVQEDGLPNFGQVVYDSIGRIEWTVEQFGVLYGKIVKNKPCTKMRIYQMIQVNSFPIDRKRRYVIAKLLSIPLFSWVSIRLKIYLKRKRKQKN